MQLDRRVIVSNLPKKGFVQDNNDHSYFYHEYQGKRTGAYTYTSYGTKYKTYGPGLIDAMKKELKLDTAKQVRDLVQCPMSAEDYNQCLIQKGVFKSESSSGSQ